MLDSVYYFLYRRPNPPQHNRQEEDTEWHIDIRLLLRTSIISLEVFIRLQRRYNTIMITSMSMSLYHQLHLILIYHSLPNALGSSLDCGYPINTPQLPALLSEDFGHLSISWLFFYLRCFDPLSLL